MKKVLATSIILSLSLALFVVPVRAQQYGERAGEVLGEKVVEKAPIVPAGISLPELMKILALSGSAGIGFTGLYKLTYKNYLFDR